MASAKGRWGVRHGLRGRYTHCVSKGTNTPVIDRRRELISSPVFTLPYWMNDPMFFSFRDTRAPWGRQKYMTWVTGRPRICSATCRGPGNTGAPPRSPPAPSPGESDPKATRSITQFAHARVFELRALGGGCAMAPWFLGVSAAIIYAAIRLKAVSRKVEVSSKSCACEEQLGFLNPFLRPPKSRCICVL